MKKSEDYLEVPTAEDEGEIIPNGAGAAAILAAGELVAPF